MKKVIIASGVAVLALAMVASAQGYTFSNNLTVGSTGADVSALQSFLIAAGYHIPAIESGAAAKGYFGSQTKTAVMQYQAANGIPNTGFVGPLTKAALNKGATASTGTGTVAVACPAGFVCTPVAGTTTGTTPAAPVGISTPGVAGTLAVSLWTTPSGVTAYKGQAYDVAAYKLQASASDMAVSSISLDFDTRLWLYASSITLKDETGAVVGTVSNLTQSNFAELTVGSDYRVTVPTNFVVKATQAKYITVNINFLGVTDRSSGTINITQAQVRAVDGTGVTDTETVSSARSFSYQSTNIAQLVVTTDPSSPTSQVVQVSTAAQTQNVPLAIYDIKSQNQPATLQTLTIGLDISSTTGSGSVTLPVGSILSSVSIKAAGLTYSASSLSTSSATFTNLQIPLAADTYVPVTVYATLAQNTNGIYNGTNISTSLDTTSTTNGTPNDVVAVDSTFNNIPSNSVSLTSNALSLSASGVTASNLSVVPPTVTANQGASSTAVWSYSVTLTAGNNPIYISATSSTALTTASTGTVGTVTNVSWSDNDSTGDTAGQFFYIAPGQSKTFTATYKSTGTPGTVAGTYSVTSLGYGTGFANGAITGAGTLTSSSIAGTLKVPLAY